MKTIIFSLTFLLVLIIGQTNAQIVNGYNANENAILHSGKATVTINTLYVEPMKDVSWPNPTHTIIISEKQVAKYISPLGFLLKPAGNIGNTARTMPVKQTKRTGIKGR
jgi:hypothetical protein